MHWSAVALTDWWGRGCTLVFPFSFSLFSCYIPRNPNPTPLVQFSLRPILRLCYLMSSLFISLRYSTKKSQTTFSKPKSSYFCQQLFLFFFFPFLAFISYPVPDQKSSHSLFSTPLSTSSLYIWVPDIPTDFSPFSHAVVIVDTVLSTRMLHKLLSFYI